MNTFSLDTYMLPFSNNSVIFYYNPSIYLLDLSSLLIISFGYFFLSDIIDLLIEAKLK